LDLTLNQKRSSNLNRISRPDCQSASLVDRPFFRSTDRSETRCVSRLTERSTVPQ